MARIIIPLPSYGFDPTETAIPWRILSESKNDVCFATPGGTQAAADERMLTGKKLGLWRKMLQAREDAVIAYRDMEKTVEFRQPNAYQNLKHEDFDAILLPGGHDKGMRAYLESPQLQRLVADFFLARKPVAAICHGVILAARSKDPGTGISVLHSYQTTALLKSQELAAYQMTRLWLGDYYRTYPGTTVEDEVRAVLSDPRQFHKGKTPMKRDDLLNLKSGFALTDRNYVSARWPGDAYNFALEFAKILP